MGQRVFFEVHNAVIPALPAVLSGPAHFILRDDKARMCSLGFTALHGVDLMSAFFAFYKVKCKFAYSGSFVSTVHSLFSTLTGYS